MIARINNDKIFNDKINFYSESCLVASEPITLMTSISNLKNVRFHLVWSLTPADDGVERARFVLNTGQQVRHLGDGWLEVLLGHCLVLDWTCCHSQLDIVSCNNCSLLSELSVSSKNHHASLAWPPPTLTELLLQINITFFNLANWILSPQHKNMILSFFL